LVKFYRIHVDKIQAKQVPLIVQTTPVKFTGNDKFYSVIRCTPDNFINIKNMINESFMKFHETTARIDNLICNNNEKLKIIELAMGRFFFRT
jgi:hypothetical protein